MKISLEVDEKMAEKIDNLKDTCGLSNKKALMNNALTLLEWAVREKKEGKDIASVKSDNGIVSKLVMPALEHPKENMPSQKAVSFENVVPD